MLVKIEKLQMFIKITVGFVFSRSVGWQIHDIQHIDQKVHFYLAKYLSFL